MIIVGQAPGRAGDPSEPLLGGRVGRRLCELMGICEAQLRSIRRVNLIDRWPGSAGKGDRFPMAEAREGAERLMPRLATETVLVLGGATARAMKLDPTPLRWHNAGSFWYSVVPHPSGVNRWWNDPANLKAARDHLREAWRMECQRA